MKATDTRLTRAITPAFLNPKSSKPRPNATAFMNWIRQGLMDGSLTYNNADSDVHFVRGGIALCSPNIIKRYLLNHEFIGELPTTTDVWKALGREVDKSGYIVRNTVTKSCLHAYQVLNRDGSLGARKIWVRLIPNANAFIWPLPSVNTRFIACEVAQLERDSTRSPNLPLEMKATKTMDEKILKSATSAESMLQFLELELAKCGVTVEFTSSISNVKAGRNKPPCIYFHTAHLDEAYKIQLATVLATVYGHQWLLSAFFSSKSERLDSVERKPGELRFMLKPYVKAPSFLQSVLELFKPYEFRLEMADMSQALMEVNKPGWVVPDELIRLGFVSKQE